MAGTNNAVRHFAEHGAAEMENRRPFVEDVNRRDRGATLFEKIDLFDVMALEQCLGFDAGRGITDETAPALKTGEPVTRL